MEKARAHRLRNWVILVTIYWHGFRVSEVVPSSTRQLGLFFKTPSGLAKAKARQAELGGASVSVIREVQRRIKGKMQPCYLLQAEELRRKPGLTSGALEGQEVTCQRLKGSMETVQDLQEHGNALLNERLAWKEWLEERSRHGKKGAAKMQQNNVLLHCENAAGGNDPLFGISRCQVWRLFSRYAREAGLPKRKRHPHCLKHTLGTDLIDAGLPLPQVQVALGHRSIASTGQYTLPREDVVSRAVGKAIRGKSDLREFRQRDLFDTK